MSAKVFISFAANDRQTAEVICQALEGRGIECWMSTRDIRGGENFQVAIVRAIRAAKVMLFVFSTNSNNSEEVKKEVALAGQYKLYVIPIRVEDVQPNEAFAYEFATRQWIDLFQGWEVALEKLTQQIALVTTAELTPPASDEPPPAPPPIHVLPPIPPSPRPEAQDAETLYREGLGHAQAGDYDEAIDCFGRALRQKPDYAEAANNRGAAYLARGLADQAITEFDRALRIRPEFAEALNNRGNALQARGELDRAVHDYDAALRLKPDLAAALLNRAMAYDRKGLSDTARKDRAAAARLGDPSAPAAQAAAGLANRAVAFVSAAFGAVLLLAWIVGAGQRGHATVDAPPASDSAAAVSPAAASSDSAAAVSATAPTPTEPSWSSASNDGRNRAIKVINQSGHALFHLYAWSTDLGESDAHDVMAGPDVISSGQDKFYTIDDGARHCTYNLKAERADSAPDLVLNNVDVCRSAQVVFSD